MTVGHEWVFRDMTIDAIFRMNFSLWYSIGSMMHFKIVATVLWLSCSPTKKASGFSSEFFLELVLQQKVLQLIPGLRLRFKIKLLFSNV